MSVGEAIEIPPGQGSNQPSNPDSGRSPKPDKKQEQLNRQAIREEAKTAVKKREARDLEGRGRIGRFFRGTYLRITEGSRINATARQLEEQHRGEDTYLLGELAFAQEAAKKAKDPEARRQAEKRVGEINAARKARAQVERSLTSSTQEAVKPNGPEANLTKLQQDVMAGVLAGELNPNLITEQYLRDQLGEANTPGVEKMLQEAGFSLAETATYMQEVARDPRVQRARQGNQAIDSYLQEHYVTRVGRAATSAMLLTPGSRIPNWIYHTPARHLLNRIQESAVTDILASGVRNSRLLTAAAVGAAAVLTGVSIAAAPAYIPILLAITAGATLAKGIHYFKERGAKHEEVRQQVARGEIKVKAVKETKGFFARGAAAREAAKGLKGKEKRRKKREVKRGLKQEREAALIYRHVGFAHIEDSAVLLKGAAVYQSGESQLQRRGGRFIPGKGEGGYAIDRAIDRVTGTERRSVDDLVNGVGQNQEATNDALSRLAELRERRQRYEQSGQQLISGQQEQSARLALHEAEIKLEEKLREKLGDNFDSQLQDYQGQWRDRINKDIRADQLRSRIVRTAGTLRHAGKTLAMSVAAGALVGETIHIISGAGQGIGGIGENLRSAPSDIVYRVEVNPLLRPVVHDAGTTQLDQWMAVHNPLVQPSQPVIGEYAVVPQNFDTTQATANFDPTHLTPGQVNPLDIHCFLPGTQITTPNGKISIEDLHQGDQLVSFDEVTKQKSVSVIGEIGKYTQESYFIINSVIRVTGHHQFYISVQDNLSLKAVEALAVGDKMVNESGAAVTIEKIEKVQEPVLVIHLLNVTPHKNFYAEGMLVHNSKAGNFGNFTTESQTTPGTHLPESVNFGDGHSVTLNGLPDNVEAYGGLDAQGHETIIFENASNQQIGIGHVDGSHITIDYSDGTNQQLTIEGGADTNVPLAHTEYSWDTRDWQDMHSSVDGNGALHLDWTPHVSTPDAVALTDPNTHEAIVFANHMVLDPNDMNAEHEIMQYVNGKMVGTGKFMTTKEIFDVLLVHHGSTQEIQSQLAILKDVLDKANGGAWHGTQNSQDLIQIMHDRGIYTAPGSDGSPIFAQQVGGGHFNPDTGKFEVGASFQNVGHGTLPTELHSSSTVDMSQSHFNPDTQPPSTGTSPDTFTNVEPGANGGFDATYADTNGTHTIHFPDMTHGQESVTAYSQDSHDLLITDSQGHQFYLELQQGNPPHFIVYDHNGNPIAPSGGQLTATVDGNDYKVNVSDLGKIPGFVDDPTQASTSINSSSQQPVATLAYTQPAAGGNLQTMTLDSHPQGANPLTSNVTELGFKSGQDVITAVHDNGSTVIIDYGNAGHLTLNNVPEAANFKVVDGVLQISYPSEGVPTYELQLHDNPFGKPVFFVLDSHGNLIPNDSGGYVILHPDGSSDNFNQDFEKHVTGWNNLPSTSNNSTPPGGQPAGSIHFDFGKGTPLENASNFLNIVFAQPVDAIVGNFQANPVIGTAETVGGAGGLFLAGGATRLGVDRVPFLRRINDHWFTRIPAGAGAGVGAGYGAGAVFSSPIMLVGAPFMAGYLLGGRGAAAGVGHQTARLFNWARGTRAVSRVPIVGRTRGPGPLTPPTLTGSQPREAARMRGVLPRGVDDFEAINTAAGLEYDSGQSADQARDYLLATLASEGITRDRLRDAIGTRTDPAEVGEAIRGLRLQEAMRQVPDAELIAVARILGITPGTNQQTRRAIQREVAAKIPAGAHVTPEAIHEAFTDAAARVAATGGHPTGREYAEALLSTALVASPGVEPTDIADGMHITLTTATPLDQRVEIARELLADRLTLTEVAGIVAPLSTQAAQGTGGRSGQQFAGQIAEGLQTLRMEVAVRGGITRQDQLQAFGRGLTNSPQTPEAIASALITEGYTPTNITAAIGRVRATIPAGQPIDGFRLLEEIRVDGITASLNALPDPVLDHLYSSWITHGAVAVGSGRANIAGVAAHALTERYFGEDIRGAYDRAKGVAQRTRTTLDGALVETQLRVPRIAAEISSANIGDIAAVADALGARTQDINGVAEVLVNSGIPAADIAAAIARVTPNAANGERNAQDFIREIQRPYFANALLSLRLPNYDALTDQFNVATPATYLTMADAMIAQGIRLQDFATILTDLKTQHGASLTADHISEGLREAHIEGLVRKNIKDSDLVRVVQGLGLTITNPDGSRRPVNSPDEARQALYSVFNDTEPQRLQTAFTGRPANYTVNDTVNALTPEVMTSAVSRLAATSVTPEVFARALGSLAPTPGVAEAVTQLTARHITAGVVVRVIEDALARVANGGSVNAAELVRSLEAPTMETALSALSVNQDQWEELGEVLKPRTRKDPNPPQTVPEIAAEAVKQGFTITEMVDAANAPTQADKEHVIERARIRMALDRRPRAVDLANLDSRLTGDFTGTRTTDQIAVDIQAAHLTDEQVRDALHGATSAEQATAKIYEVIFTNNAAVLRNAGQFDRLVTELALAGVLAGSLGPAVAAATSAQNKHIGDVLTAISRI